MILRYGNLKSKYKEIVRTRFIIGSQKNPETPSTKITQAIKKNTEQKTEILNRLAYGLIFYCRDL